MPSEILNIHFYLLGDSGSTKLSKDYDKLPDTAKLPNGCPIYWKRIVPGKPSQPIYDFFETLKGFIEHLHSQGFNSLSIVDKFLPDRKMTAEKKFIQSLLQNGISEETIEKSLCVVKKAGAKGFILLNNYDVVPTGFAVDGGISAKRFVVVVYFSVAVISSSDDARSLFVSILQAFEVNLTSLQTKM